MRLLNLLMKRLDILQIINTDLEQPMLQQVSISIVAIIEILHKVFEKYRPLLKLKTDDTTPLLNMLTVHLRNNERRGNTGFK